MRIEIATTPNKGLKETGFGGTLACESVCESLRKAGHDVFLNVCETESDLSAIAGRKPDIVVLAVKYLKSKNREKLWMADFFEHNHINYTGSHRAVLEYDSNKVTAKEHLRKQGVSTADFFTATPGQFAGVEDMPIDFPLFVKPMDAANGNGVDDHSFVETIEGFQNKVSSLFETYHLPVLVEQFLDGREFTVAVIQSPDGTLIVSAIEILPPESTNGLRILGAKTKREDTETLISITDQDLMRTVQNLAISAFQKLGVRDFGRIDIKSRKDGAHYFLEANLVPGMTSGSSYFPKACQIANLLSYDDVVRLMLESAASRIPQRLTACCTS